MNRLYNVRGLKRKILRTALGIAQTILTGMNVVREYPYTQMTFIFVNKDFLKRKKIYMSNNHL